MTSVSSQLPSLQKAVPEHVSILTDENDATFKDLIRRWSDTNLKIPSAIIVPTTEHEIQQIVQWALKSSIPFVVKSGGHSEWSTIGKEGVVIDLSRYSGVEFDKQSNTATIWGSIVSKEVAVKLAERGRCTALGDGNTVGSVGYFLGGGLSLLKSVTGYGAEYIVGARLITAKGDLIDVTPETQPDLLWALRGAGQFFGLVTKLVINTLPLSALGNDKGLIWGGVFVFPLDRAQEVAPVMASLMNNDKYPTSGLMMIMAPPPDHHPCLVIAANLTGNPDEAPNAFKPLYDLKPIHTAGGPMPLQNANDGTEHLGAKGGYKKFRIVGLHGFDINTFMKTVDIWRDLVKNYPSAISTPFNFQWDSRLPKSSGVDTPLSLGHVRFWQNNVTWHNDPSNDAKIDEYSVKCIETVRSGKYETEQLDFVNGTRTGPVAHRYPGAEKLGKLKTLKAKWDPQGVFTRQLL